MRQFLKQSQIRFIVFLIALTILLVLGNFFAIDQAKIDSFFKTIPLGFSSLAFIIFYIIGTFFLWYLKDPLKLIGAVIFGAYISTILIYIAEIVNAFIFFVCLEK